MVMHARGLTPILNVSDIRQSFAWFEEIGWEKGWDWGSPPTFGAVRSGGFEIFLCQGAQGGRGKSELATTWGSGEAARRPDVAADATPAAGAHRVGGRDGLEFRSAWRWVHGGRL